MKYSIVIVTYNRCDLLKECITCALQQTIAATHIVVIIICDEEIVEVWCLVVLV